MAQHRAPDARLVNNILCVVRHRHFRVAGYRVCVISTRQENKEILLLREQGHPVYLKEWRDHAGLSQEVVAERIGKSREQLSKIENGKHGYKEWWLVKLAAIYGCEPADLISRRPTDPTGLYTIINRLRPTQQERARAYLEGLRDGAVS